MKLYDGRMSWNGRKVRLLAAELGVPLERITLDFQSGQYKTADYLAKNPNGKVPTLEDEGFVVWESHAILKYLASKHPERGLAGRDVKEQAHVDQWLFWHTANLDAPLNTLLRERMIKQFMGQPGNDPSLCADAEAQLARFLPILDAQLATREYVVGPLTVVDFAIASQFEVAPRLQVDLAPYANIGRWLARLSAKPYWKDA
jgi:glutathione S-transferase